MACDEYREMISADLDSELREAEEIALWSHLADCAECRRWRREQQTIRADFVRWPEEPLPERVHLVRDRETGRFASVYHIPRFLAWAAAIVVFAEAAYIASPLLRLKQPVPTVTTPMIEAAEKITLGPADCVWYRVVDRGSSPVQFAPGKTGG